VPVSGEAKGEADDSASVSKVEEHGRWTDAMEHGDAARRLAVALGC
jgi:hypothetical protein